MVELTQHEFDGMLAVIKMATVLAGIFIAYLGLKAYRKDRQQPVLWLTVGILVLTAAAVSEALALQGLGWSIDQSHVFEAIVTLFGFLILIYSLIVD